MDITTFNQILEERITKTRNTLKRKETEYMRDNERLYNFKRAARMLKCEPIEVLKHWKAKHDVSVLDIMEDFEKGIIPDKKLIDEKLGDAINYLILLEALLIENQTYGTAIGAAIGYQAGQNVIEEVNS